MTLDEAVRRERHALRQTTGERSEEHRQVAEWLRLLREMLDGAWEVTLQNCDLKSEIARYRELIRILGRDWGIEASWDGLRKFWYVGLNEKGVAERDEREAVRMAHVETINELEAENAKLRGLLTEAVGVAVDYYRGVGVWSDIEGIADEMRELGIEVG